MLSRTVVFIILALFVFSALVAFIPVAFLIGLSAQDPAAIEELTAANLIVYAQSGSDNMTYSYTSLTDAPDPPKWSAGLPENQYVEFWWSQEGLIPKHIAIRHVAPYLGGWTYMDLVSIYYMDGSLVEGDGYWDNINKEVLLRAWDSSAEGSLFTAKCSHMSMSVIFKPGEGYSDIGVAYDADLIDYFFSYEWSEEASGFSILTILARLFTFQGLGLGIPGVFGTLIDQIISMFFYIGLAYIIYKIFAGLIPTMSGGSGD